MRCFFKIHVPLFSFKCEYLTQWNYERRDSIIFSLEIIAIVITQKEGGAGSAPEPLEPSLGYGLAILCLLGSMHRFVPPFVRSCTP